jgi:hypothetical protein
MSTAGHLVRRFFGSLRTSGPPPGDEAWARDALLAGERPLWDRMSNPDRRHAVAVARRAEAALGPRATRPVVAAALLHDVGKIDSGFGTFARVGVTLAAAVVGHRWLSRRPGRVGRYVRHDVVGAELLEQAGSDPLTRAWAREHHSPKESWTIDEDLGTALKAADDD